MEGFFQIKENLSYIFEAFETTPTKLPEDLPWAILPSRELFKKFFDQCVDNQIVCHFDTTIEIYKKMKTLYAEKKIQKSSAEEKKIRAVLEEEKIEMEASKQRIMLSMKSHFLNLSETQDFPKLLKINKFYLIKIRGAYSTNFEKYMSTTFDGMFFGKTPKESFIQILIKFFKLYLSSYDWRMENYHNLQKFIFKLKHIHLGLTNDLRYVVDILCPKLYSLEDKDAVSYSNFNIKLETNKITTEIELNTFEEKILINRTEETEWNFPPVQLIQTEVPQTMNLTYVSQKWKSEAFVLIPLIIQFFTFIPGPHPLIHNNGDLFQIALQHILDSHVSPPKEKVEELVDYYFEYLLYDYRDIFVEIVYTILYSPDGTVKQGFDADVHRIIEILNQYVQAV